MKAVCLQVEGPLQASDRTVGNFLPTRTVIPVSRNFVKVFQRICAISDIFTVFIT